MNVFVACESSGKVRNAFLKAGHNAWSCDLLPADDGSPYHLQMDVRSALTDRFDISQWDMIIAFPPCTHLASSGARWFKEKQADGRQQEAIDFFEWFTELPTQMVAIENPVGIMSTRYRKPDQIIQPWQFGHGETKATCLWLKGLPKLVPTNIVEGREQRVWKMGPSADRWKKRSETYQGIADAMAAQWRKND